MTTTPENHANGVLPPMPETASGASSWPVFEEGWVWLAGAGPGDPGLVTLHTLNALKQADVIVYDALIDPRILDWANPNASIEYAGKRGGKPSLCNAILPCG